MQLNEFVWAIDYPIWASNPPEKIFDLRPRDVLNDLNSHLKHKEKIFNADCEYPIHVMQWHEKLLILDGFHRLLKKIILKETEILVKIVPKSEIMNIQPDPQQPTGYYRYSSNH